ncbi:MAG: photosystem II biogenesis protein Psp29 [Cyanobacteria bacterium P01_D01_bin.105]
MNNVRTVSDTKRAFYGAHTRPISALYRRVVEELMVEMHLLLVNVNFAYDSIYALGVVSVFDRFMAGYSPESDQLSIYNAIIAAVEGDPAQYRSDAENASNAAKQVPSIEAFKSLLEEAKQGGGGILKDTFHQVISNDKYKYSRLFTTGLYNVIEAIDESALADKEKREALLTETAEALGFNSELLIKDVELYRGNLEKMAQAQEVMKDMIEAEKKKQAQREKDKAERAAKKESEAKAAAEASAESATDSSAE